MYESSLMTCCKQPSPSARLGNSRKQNQEEQIHPPPRSQSPPLPPAPPPTPVQSVHEADGFSDSGHSSPISSLEDIHSAFGINEKACLTESRIQSRASPSRFTKCVRLATQFRERVSKSWIVACSRPSGSKHSDVRTRRIVIHVVQEIRYTV
jgi:hypothetical protein